MESAKSHYNVGSEHLMDAESLALTDDISLDIKPHQLGSHSFLFFHLKLSKRTNYAI